MKRILFIDGTTGYSPTRLGKKATGGIATSLTKIPQYLASNGWEVYVTANEIAKSVFLNGVNYIKALDECVDPAIVVLNRNLVNHSILSMFDKAKFIWWLHDIVDHRYLEDDAFKKVDSIVALSEYCRMSYSEFYGIAESKFTVIPNAVDSEVFYPGEYKDRDPNLFVQASAPIKGLYPVWFTFKNLKRLNPKVVVRLYCSQKLHDLDDTRYEAQMKELKDSGIEIAEPIAQAELADVFRRAWCLMMPNHYPEICSNTLLQARACGLPIVASNIGSASEFIQHGENGLLTHTHPHDMYLWWGDFAKQCIEMTMNTDAHKRMSECTPVGVMGWNTAGEKWYTLVEQLFEARQAVEVLESVGVK